MKARKAPKVGPPRVGRLVGRLLLAGCGSLVLLVFLLRWVNPPTTAFMSVRRFEAWKVGERHFVLRQHWVPLENMSRDLPLAVVASEDQKFFQHFGFDVEAIADAVEDRFEGKASRGASSLTQQVAKNLFLWQEPSFLRKGLEAVLTLLLELLWSKHRILEVYLNVAEFGDGIYGVEAASRAFFGKSARQLSLDESALLASVLPAPKRRSVKKPSEAMKARSEWIIDQRGKLKIPFPSAH